MNHIPRILFVILAAVPLLICMQTSEAAEIDDFKALLRSGVEDAASLKRCTDELNGAVAAMSSDSAFAGSLFKAVTSGNSAAVQTLYAQKAPSCTVSVTSIEKDFAFRLTFGDPKTGNHFFLCFASRNHPKKCPDGTGADVSLTLQ